MDALNDALARASTRAETLDEVVGTDVGEPGRLVAPTETAWCWFGRESRFALDEHRRAVTTTMPGHHRIKASHESASAGVDFAEALCDPNGEFPFGVVTRQFGPVKGDRVRIGHGKPDGRLILLGSGEVVDYDGDEGTLSVERQMSPGGNYDALDVPRESGDIALTKFREGRWWYPTVYRDSEGERKGTYVNVCTPVECFPDTIRYVDLHVDVVKHADGRVQRVDDDELDAAVEAGEISSELAEKARDVASALERAL
jgi:Ribonuclease G/E